MSNYQETREKALQRRALNEQIKSLLVSYLELNCEPGQITDDQPLFGRGLGLDSLDALELVVGIEEAFEVSVSDDDISSLSSVNKIAEYILAFQQGREPVAAPMFEQHA
ncbi:acyl carrier protein [Thermosporothrix hazakensis]|jgi:acyl carrier protein|uniref:Acyl carrier protein n=2 Tax=Thermosporothrix TaxID=768650 RepID=A0A326TZC7_THEHA|nr:phosphopantetheine-binding protein [Thermosporothrix hazakensis]PZW22834.1 acyl carrier protein [Thermosporothrix hazakensis]BBH91659.1 acyl carrier protein [Thermosporothrix sp. COM3]GCE49801.1 acyl carrier protein [Thermosporothrix hazakensis]